MTNYKIKKPVVTVYMPVFNSEKYLADSIESILTQTYSHFEFIMIDDGSTDSSWKIIRSYARKDSRIRAYKNKINLGVSLNSNIAISLARGQYIARIDADDIAFPDRLRKQLSYLKNHPDTVAVGGQCITIDNDNLIIGHKKFPTNPEKLASMLFWAVPIQQPSMMVNRKKLPKNFTWYEKNKTSAEETTLMFNLLKYGNLANLPDYLLYYRQLPTSLSHQNPRLTYYLTLQSRLNALSDGYSPTFPAIIINLIQFCAINLLPASTINWLWNSLRGINGRSNEFTVGTLATTKV
jgi:glycosyltransferase involved in cell wall biosynthesis